MRLLNRARTTVWRMVQAGQLRGFKDLGVVLIPLADIAAVLGITERQLYDITVAHRIPLWHYYR